MNLVGKSQVLGKIEFDNQPIEMEDPNLRNLIAECSVKVRYAHLLLSTYCISHFRYESFRDENSAELCSVIVSLSKDAYIIYYILSSTLPSQCS